MLARSTQTSFWPTAIGGFVLGVLTVLIVLLLARQTGNDEPPRPAAPETPAASSP